MIKGNDVVLTIRYPLPLFDSISLSQSLVRIIFNQMEMDDHNNNKALFKEVFGDSSDSDDNEQQKTQQPQLELEEAEVHQNPSWEQIKEIKGLWLCRDFLSPRQQSSLVSAILNGACVSLLLCTTFLLNWVSPTLTHCVFCIVNVCVCTCRRMVHWTLTQPGPFHILMLMLKWDRLADPMIVRMVICNSSHHLNFHEISGCYFP